MRDGYKYIIVYIAEVNGINVGHESNFSSEDCLSISECFYVS